MRRGAVRRIWRLIRILPVTAWSLAGLAIGAGAAFRGPALCPSPLAEVFWMIGGSVMVQGCLGHAANDLMDWSSGTDARSPGVLSGGSRVLPLRLATPSQLVWLAWVALAATAVVGFHFALRVGWPSWLIVAVGVWSALAYSLPPLLLSYRPLAGEWLAAWPAAFTCATGSFFLLTGRVTGQVLAAGTLHATSAVAWLAQHHIPDVTADLSARPRKTTTVAWASARYGPAGERSIPAVYSALAAGLAVAFAVRTPGSPASVFVVPSLLSSAGALLALRQSPGSLRSQTWTELGMIGLSLAQAAWLAARLYP